MATVEYLGETTLQTLGDTTRTFKASELWSNTGIVMMVVRRPGCMMCREEAKELSALKPQFESAGFQLKAVVHEALGVEDFQLFFGGEIFLDSERRFYGPHERWGSLTAMFKPSFWSAYARARGKGVSGNLAGEGRLLGGLFVIAPGSKGILFEHQEKTFGDHAKHEDLLAAVEGFKSKSAASG